MYVFVRMNEMFERGLNFYHGGFLSFDALVLGDAASNIGRNECKIRNIIIKHE